MRSSTGAEPASDQGAHRPVAQRRPTGRRLSPSARNRLVVLHVTVSVSWLALMLCLLTLAVTALTTDDADRLRTAYRAMGILGDALILPLSLLTFLSGVVLGLGLLTFLSGVVLGLGTSWGLFRYYWVSTKFWLTLGAMAASVLALTDRLHDAVRVVDAHPTGPIAAMDLGFVRYATVIAPSVALALYLFNVVLSVFKPWGRRPGGARRGRIPGAAS
ncbi:DUF2269 domain-containing protein [Kitasatospora sp. NPDC086801]|uniref:DUF2269 domain-containing protein n=1 Tax=Kitasatospora sp. NPDC086801 TaxID=3364066 RepID=UPI0038226F95